MVAMPTMPVPAGNSSIPMFVSLLPADRRLGGLPSAAGHFCM